MSQLIGTWIAACKNSVSTNNSIKEKIQFCKNGTLIYTIQSQDTGQIIKMSYYVRDNIIVTNQLSAPKIEYTVFEIDESGSLLLYFGGEVFAFSREDH